MIISYCYQNIYFNTSHVTVYLLAVMIREKYLNYFNTSHVTVYPVSVGFASLVNKFQYISCYCLSQERKKGVFKDYEFQYISCYCLSNYHCHFSKIQQYFNTSHVTVYRFVTKNLWVNLVFQYISCYCLSQ